MEIGYLEAALAVAIGANLPASSGASRACMMV
jgi:hypothetical protein